MLAKEIKKRNSKGTGRGSRQTDKKGRSKIAKEFCGECTKTNQQPDVKETKQCWSKI